MVIQTKAALENIKYVSGYVLHMKKTWAGFGKKMKLLHTECHKK